MKEPETLVLPLHHPAKSLKRGEYKQWSMSWQYYIQFKLRMTTWDLFSRIIQKPHKLLEIYNHGICLHDYDDYGF